MQFFKLPFRLTSKQASQLARWSSISITVLVIATLLLFNRQEQAFAEDLDNFFVGGSLDTLGQAANFQREMLKAHLVLKEMQLNSSPSSDEFRQRYASSKTSLRILNSRAESDDRNDAFAQDSLLTLELINQSITEINQLEENLIQYDSDTAAVAPVLNQIDDLFETVDLEVNKFYRQQELFQAQFRADALAQISRSRRITIFVSALLLLTGMLMLFAVQRTSTIEQVANERFRLASAAVRSAIYDWDAQQDKMVWTNGLREVFGHSDAEKFNTLEAVWQLVHPDDRLLLREKYENAAQMDSNFSAEHRFMTAQGDYLDVSNRIQIVTDTKGKVTRLVGSIEDITERRLMMTYKESNHAKNRLLAHVSHELKTPLNAIIGYAEIVQMGIHGEVTEAQDHSLGRLLANARNLVELINSLLSQLRAEDQEDTITLGLFSPADLVTAMYDAVGVLAESKGVELTHEIDDRLSQELISDIGRLRQIIINLAGNAVKFTDEGSIHLHLFSSSDKEWGIRLQDTGIGISAEDQEKIFQAFSQVNDELQADARGFGLGLSIVSQIVNQLGGTIHLDSKLGEGSIFTVTLPSITHINTNTQTQTQTMVTE